MKIAKTGALTVRLDPELKGAWRTPQPSSIERERFSAPRTARSEERHRSDYKIELPLEMALAKAPIIEVAPILAFLIISS
jgi:hypothetical protein